MKRPLLSTAALPALLVMGTVAAHAQEPAAPQPQPSPPAEAPEPTTPPAAKAPEPPSTPIANGMNGSTSYDPYA